MSARSTNAVQHMVLKKMSNYKQTQVLRKSFSGYLILQGISGWQSHAVHCRAPSVRKSGNFIDDAQEN